MLRDKLLGVLGVPAFFPEIDAILLTNKISTDQHCKFYRSHMPYYIEVSLLAFSCYEVCYSVNELLTLFRHSSRCEEYSQGEGSLLILHIHHSPSTHPSSCSRSFRKLLEELLSCLTSNWGVIP